MKNGDKLFFFDFDGTIVNSMRHYLSHYNCYARENKKPVLTEVDFQKLRTEPYNEVRKKLGLGLIEAYLLDKKLKREIYKNPHRVQLTPGIKEVFQEIQQNDSLIYIISSNSKQNIAKVLHAHNINKVEKIIHTFRAFNKTYFLRKLLQEHQNYKHAFLISDEYKDIIAANKLGIISIAVTWGANNFNHKLDITPTYIVDQPLEILSTIRNLHL
ncbi:MAG TPA: HAD hydrolase-like protein [Legionella sp.]|nr:HAD hydrolase-like protein [Legionella sp.]